MIKVQITLFRVLIFLLRLLSILKAMEICLDHDWGFILCGLIAIAIFGCMYGFYRLGFVVAKHITYFYAKVYKNKMIPRIEMQTIDRYIAEHPLPETKQEDMEKSSTTIQSMNDSNYLKNAQINLNQFMATCKRT